ncbi:MAG: class III extradiol ring-cleavage dioxygenase [Pseudomonadota bacterium]
MHIQQPSIFVSHGAPTLAIEDGPAHRFLKMLGPALPKPDAVIVVSAHHESDVTEIACQARPETIHDFGGFPAELYQIRYPALSDENLARRIHDTLTDGGILTRLNSERGLDHGAWVPLTLMYPLANVPVVQVSLNVTETANYHVRVGKLLASFRNDNILILASGSTTHNLAAYFSGRFRHDAPPQTWVTEFSEWLSDRIEYGAWSQVLAAVDEGPFGRRNHPTREHILPLFVSLGARLPGDAAARLHASTTYSVLAMDVFGFGEVDLLNEIRAKRLAAINPSNGGASLFKHGAIT